MPDTLSDQVRYPGAVVTTGGRRAPYQEPSAPEINLAEATVRLTLDHVTGDKSSNLANVANFIVDLSV